MTLIQARMARAALNWTTRQLTQAADVPGLSVSRFLVGQTVDPGYVARMRRAFEEAGITFVESKGMGSGAFFSRKGDEASSSSSSPATDVVEMIEEHESKALTIASENLNSSADD